MCTRQIQSHPSSESCIFPWPSMMEKHLLHLLLPDRKNKTNFKTSTASPGSIPCSYSPLVALDITPGLLYEGQLLVWATLLRVILLSCPCQRGLPSLPLPGQRYMSILGAFFFFFQIFCKVDHFKIQNWSGRMKFKPTRLRTRDLKAESSSNPNLARQS